jgi:hypothetical protein
VASGLLAWQERLHVVIGTAKYPSKVVKVPNPPRHTKVAEGLIHTIIGFVEFVGRHIGPTLLFYKLTYTFGWERRKHLGT